MPSSQDPCSHLVVAYDPPSLFWLCTQCSKPFHLTTARGHEPVRAYRIAYVESLEDQIGQLRASLEEDTRIFSLMARES